MHIDLNVAIEKRENFDATNRETIFVQNIDFFDVAIDEKSDENFEKVTDDSITDFDDTFSERSRTISDVKIAKNKNFDDVKKKKIIDRNDEKNDDSKTNKTTTNC